MRSHKTRRTTHQNRRPFSIAQDAYHAGTTHFFRYLETRLAQFFGHPLRRLKFVKRQFRMTVAMRIKSIQIRIIFINSPLKHLLLPKSRRTKRKPQKGNEGI